MSKEKSLTEKEYRGKHRAGEMNIEDKIKLAIREFKKRIETGYHERLTKGKKDYPPFNPNPFRDRFDYEKYMMGVLDEVVEEFFGIKK